ncbi:unnamed protein product [Cochlearia groenlandica]
MAPNPNIKEAYLAMKDLGISNTQVKPVLKDLLELYDKNWALIAEDNYRVLADAIFEAQDTQPVGEDEDDLDEPERPLKRLRRRSEGCSALTMSKSTSPSLGSPTLKETCDEENAPTLLPFQLLPTEKDPDELLTDTSIRGSPLSLVSMPNMEKNPGHVDAGGCGRVGTPSDITLGKEAVEIQWVNEVNDKVPPYFRYIAQSVVYLDAEVKFLLANITSEQCCSSCFGDCLASSVSCTCATALDGFAYTVDGLLKQDFLEECISEAHDPRRQLVQYCKECPLERGKKEEILEPCKGHLKRKVIKECWSKCGCIKRCGNRVVQHGIHKKFQVFFTSNGRGWGLRTLEKLPKGAFVCEFAGEILTIPELYKRSSEKLNNPVILEALWGSEELVDNKALCLDGMHFGNISRFINHRCLDANLLEIPVHVESSDLHYYHLAFFTTREIDAMEELTWDYGVEFNDDVFPTTPFHCQCGSEFCRNIKRRSCEFIITRSSNTQSCSLTNTLLSDVCRRQECEEESYFVLKMN